MVPLASPLSLHLLSRFARTRGRSARARLPPRALSAGGGRLDGREPYDPPMLTLRPRRTPLADGRGAPGRTTHRAAAGGRGLARERGGPRDASRPRSGSSGPRLAVYGVVLLWPSVIEAVQTANVSLPLDLLVAVMWQYRERLGGGRHRPRVRGCAEALSVAPRDLARADRSLRAAAWRRSWPRRRCSCSCRSRASPTTSGCCATSGDVRARLLYALRAARGRRRAGHARAGRDRRPRRSRCWRVAWRRRSLGLAIAAALVLSPIVWRHFFTLLIVPLALSCPRFAAVWLIPVGMWIGDGTLNGAPWQNAGVLALAALTFSSANDGPGDARRMAASARIRCTREP